MHGVAAGSSITRRIRAALQEERLTLPGDSGDQGDRCVTLETRLLTLLL